MEDVEYEGKQKNAADVEEEPEIVESDIELDDSEVVEPDNDPPQQVGILTFPIIYIYIYFLLFSK